MAAVLPSHSAHLICLDDQVMAYSCNPHGESLWRIPMENPYCSCKLICLDDQYDEPMYAANRIPVIQVLPPALPPAPPQSEHPFLTSSLPHLPSSPPVLSPSPPHLHLPHSQTHTAGFVGRPVRAGPGLRGRRGRDTPHGTPDTVHRTQVCTRPCVTPASMPSSAREMRLALVRPAVPFPAERFSVERRCSGPQRHSDCLPFCGRRGLQLQSLVRIPTAAVG